MGKLEKRKKYRQQLKNGLNLLNNHYNNNYTFNTEPLNWRMTDVIKKLKNKKDNLDKEIQELIEIQKEWNKIRNIGICMNTDTDRIILSYKNRSYAIFLDDKLIKKIERIQ